MKILERLAEIIPELTKSEKRLAEFILYNPIDLVRYNSADQIAALNHCSRASLIRLAQKLGYAGFAEFKNEFNQEMLDHITPNSSTVLDYYATAINGLQDLFQTVSFQNVISVLKNASVIYTTGANHSHYSAMQMTFRLNRHKHASSCIDNATSLYESPGLFLDGAVLVIFSISGGYYSDQFLKPLQELEDTRTFKTILITMTNNTPYSRFADETLILPCVSRMCKNAVIDDAAVFYLAIEMIIDQLNKAEKEA